MNNYKIGKCQRCGKEISLTIYNRKYCKECAKQVHKEQNKQWYKEHPKKEGYKLRFCKRCGKEFKPTSSTQIFCEECKSIKQKEWRVKYYLKNRDELIVKRIKYHKEHLDKEKEYRKRYKLEHREQINKWMREWIKEHPEQKLYKKQYLKQYRQTEHGKIVHLFNDNKRYRNLDYIPLNSYKSYKDGYVFHHLDKVYGIYIPEEIHKSIWHSVIKNINMDTINALAFNFIGDFDDM